MRLARLNRVLSFSEVVEHLRTIARQIAEADAMTPDGVYSIDVSAIDVARSPRLTERRIRLA